MLLGMLCHACCVCYAFDLCHNAGNGKSCLLSYRSYGRAIDALVPKRAAPWSLRSSSCVPRSSCTSSPSSSALTPGITRDSVEKKMFGLNLPSLYPPPPHPDPRNHRRPPRHHRPSWAPHHPSISSLLRHSLSHHHLAHVCACRGHCLGRVLRPQGLRCRLPLRVHPSHWC